MQLVARCPGEHTNISRKKKILFKKRVGQFLRLYSLIIMTIIIFIICKVVKLLLLLNLIN